MLTLARLEGFYAVARHGSYRRAAQLFSYPITPSGLHQQVHRLEKELGVQLLRRLNRNDMATTPAGAQLLAHLTPFLEQLPHVAASLTSAQPSGVLKLATSMHLLKHFLPRPLRRFHQALPKASVDFVETREPDLSPVWLGGYDVFVDFVPHTLPGLVATQVGSLNGYLVTPKDGKPWRAADFVGQPFVAYSEGRSNRIRQLEGLARLGLKPSTLVSAESSEAILGLVAGGLGYSLVPMLPSATPQYSLVRFQSLSKQGAVFPISAVCRKADLAPGTLVSSFMAALGGA
jgi:LysR family hydrogen peroxide-inducible transcriptional activator